MAGILAARDDRDEGLLRAVGLVLVQGNPDITVLWNIRKETLLHLKAEKGDAAADALLAKELDLSQQCLASNPKSYGAWHHRRWCLLQMAAATPDWAREVGLCDAYLAADERNFHCWDHRRFVVARQAGGDPASAAVSELEMTMDRINVNFSNYSAWHHRSKLLPLLYPGNDGGLISEAKRRDELDLVQNAAFTDPEDSSAWFYHTWLLGGGGGNADNNKASVVAMKVGAASVTAAFSLPVRAADVAVLVDGAEVTPSAFAAPDVEEGGAVRHSALWTLTLGAMAAGTRVALSVAGSSLKGAAGGDAVLSSSATLPASKTADAATAEVLRQDLQNCRDLLELEPESKWTRLSLVLVLRALDEDAHAGDVADSLDALAGVDPKRAGYYGDLRSRLAVERRTRAFPVGGELVLSGLRLTRLVRPERLFLVRRLDLSGNGLTSTAAFLPFLLSCEELLLDGNRLAAVDGLEGAAAAACLRVVSLVGNPLRRGEPEALRARRPEIEFRFE